MGFLLVGGVVFLAGVVWKKVSADIAVAGDTPRSSACEGGKVDLKGRGAAMESVAEGNRLRLTFKRPEGGRDIVFVDMCSGKITGELTVETDTR